MSEFFKNKAFTGAVFLFVFALTFTRTLAQSKLILNKENVGVARIDVIPFLRIDGDINVKALKTEVINRLPINKAQLFYFRILNETTDTLLRFIFFPNRYVTASNFIVKDLYEGQRTITQKRSNSLEIRLPPKSERLVLFSLDELNRAEDKKLNLVIVTKDFQEKRTEQIYRTQAFFMGILAFLFLFNLIIFFVTRWKVYVLYATYIFSALIYFLYYFGLLQHVFPSINEVPINLTYTWYSIIFISYFVFLNAFGDYKNLVPRAYLLLNVGIIFKSVETFINTILHLLDVNFIYSEIYINTIIFLEIILMFFIVFYILKNKHPRGKFVIVASIFLIIGAIFEQTKWLPELENIYFVEFGILAELLTFSIGLGYITKLYYEEKRNAELKYIEQLVTNDLLQKQNTEQLEILVKHRTEELRSEKLKVEKKNAENELLLAEIHHRVKNNLQVVSSLLNLQEKNITNADAKRAILEGKERIRSMELVHKMLYRTNSFSGVEMKDYVDKLSYGLIESFGINREEVQMDLKFEKIVLDVDTATPVGLILNELIINSLKHAKKNKVKLVVTIEMIETKEGILYLKVSDNGEGKVSDLKNSNSFGLKIIMSLIRQLSGQISIEENNGLYYSINLNCKEIV